MFVVRDCKRIKKCIKLILFFEEKNLRELSFMKIYSRSYFNLMFGNGLKMNIIGIIKFVSKEKCIVKKYERL